MAGHYRNLCKHGVVVGQCRCPGLKEERLVPCPKDHEYKYDLKTLAQETASKSIPEDKLIDFFKRVNPVLHEPLATVVAKEWAGKFREEFGL